MVIEKLSSIKGVCFVVVTAMLLYFGLRRQLRRWEKATVARQKAEAESKTTEAKFRSYVEHAPIAFFVVNRLGQFVDANPPACQLTGYDNAELLRLNIADLVVEPDRERALREFAELAAGGHLEKEYTLKKRGGATALISLRAVKINDDRFLGFCQDISQLRKNEQTLQASHAQIQYIIDNTWDIIFQIDLQGNYTYANAAAGRATGYPLDELLKMNMWQLSPPDQHALLKNRMQTQIANEALEKTFELEILHRDGHRLWLEITSSRVVNIAGKLTGIQGVAREISGRKQAETQLRKLSLAVEHSPVSIIITDTAGNIEYVNPKFSEVSGYAPAEVCGKNPRLLKGDETRPEEYQRLWHDLTAGQQWRGTFHNRKKSGELYWESASISPITDEVGRITHFLAIKEDITKQKTLEEQVRQMQKMEAFGQLAGGVAHDFNNILAIVQMQASTLRMNPDLSPEIADQASEIETAAQRGANLTRQLLMFSRRQPLKPCDLNLNDILTSITKMLQRILGEDIQMQFKYAPEPLFIHADASMMGQVLMNLAVNSRDALPKGGQLSIETTAVEFDETTVNSSAQSRPGAFACLSVSDTGSGIPPEILPRIFEPFFTTKDIGKGTGLGLATVFGIVQQHQGWINVSSEAGRGTTFRIYLPRLAGPAKPAHAKPSPETICGGHETILLVEDDVPLRRVARIVLTNLGYRVLEAADGTEALRLWQANRHDIRLLVTDLVMPGGMTGKELAEELLKHNPKLKVIYASGYSRGIASKDLHLEEGVNFITKPFSSRNFAQIIRKQLDEK